MAGQSNESFNPLYLTKSICSKLNGLKNQLFNVVSSSRKYLYNDNEVEQELVAACEDCVLRINTLLRPELLNKDYYAQNTTTAKSFADKFTDTCNEYNEDLSNVNCSKATSRSYNKRSEFMRKLMEHNKLVGKEGEKKCVIDTEAIEKVKDHIQQVVTMARNYQDEGLLSESVNDFISYCERFQKKINNYAHDKEKLTNFKEKITKLQDAIVKENVESSSITSFLNNCDDFKDKLQFVHRKRSLSSASIEELIEHISNAIFLSKTAKDMGIAPGYMDNFIQVCDKILQKILAATTSQDQEEESLEPQLITALSYNIDDIIAYVTKYKNMGMISPSVEDFLKKCKEIKSKLDDYKGVGRLEGYEIGPKQQTECPFLNLPCSSCDISKESASAKSAIEMPPLIPGKVCDACNTPTRKPEQLTLNKKPSLTQTKKPEHPVLKIQSSPVELKKPEQSISNIKSSLSELKKPVQSTLDIKPPLDIQDEPLASNANLLAPTKVLGRQKSCYSFDSLLPDETKDKIGYFEKRKKKIIRVDRYLDENGQVKEEKKVITIKRKVHDPLLKQLVDDDDDSDIEDDDNGEGFLIATCSLPTNKGFLKVVRNAKSENSLKGSFITPVVKRCISEESSFT